MLKTFCNDSPDSE